MLSSDSAKKGHNSDKSNFKRWNEMTYSKPWQGTPCHLEWIGTIRKSQIYLTSNSSFSNSVSRHLWVVASFRPSHSSHSRNAGINLTHHMAGTNASWEAGIVGIFHDEETRGLVTFFDTVTYCTHCRVTKVGSLSPDTHEFWAMFTTNTSIQVSRHYLCWSQWWWHEIYRTCKIQ